MSHWNIYYTPEHSRHNPRIHSICGRQDAVEASDRGHPECASRIPPILRAIETTLGEEKFRMHFSTRQATIDELSQCHTREMIEFFSHCWERAQELHEDLEEVVPGTFPNYVKYEKPHFPTKDVLTQAGIFCVDTCTPVGEFSIECAKQAAAAAIDGARAMELDPSARCFVLTRPPGHHSCRGTNGGFCYLNSVSIATCELLTKLKKRNSVKLGAGKPRVAIVDLDYHHGNGTQDIFYESSEVAYFSIHAHPDFEFPHFSGMESERGFGDGEGYNFNFPQPEHASYDTHYRSTLDRIIEIIQSDGINPEMVVVSLGLDGLEGDTVGQYSLQPEDFGSMAKQLKGLGLPVFAILEGGYNKEKDRMGKATVSFLQNYL